MKENNILPFTRPSGPDDDPLPKDVSRAIVKIFNYLSDQGIDSIYINHPADKVNIMQIDRLNTDVYNRL